MSLQIDDMYMQQVTIILDKCVRVDSYTYNFRCPYCGDSQTNLSKKRGYVHMNESKDGLFFKCHNCGEAKPFGKFLQERNPVLYRDYIVSQLKGSGSWNRKKKPEPTKKPDIPREKYNRDNFFGLKKLSELSGDHPAITDFIKKRQIPRKFCDDLFYVENFRELFKKIYPDKESDNIPADSRIVIPFVNKEGVLENIQARALGPTSLRYFSLKIVEGSEKIYGMDRIDMNKPVYIFEGPIDSMFVDNAIAVADASLFKYADKFDDCVCVFDYQPLNKNLKKIINKTIDKNQKVCILPNLGGKDINDIIINRNIKLSDVKKLIDQYTFKDLEAKLMLASWR